MTEMVTEPEVAAEETARRGRPRPTATIERDNRVRDALAAEGSTRNEVVAALEAAGASVSAAQVYLSLFRLNKLGTVERVRDGAAHKWRRVTPTQPTE